MCIVIPHSQLQTLVSIVRGDRRRRRGEQEFLRVPAIGEELSVAGPDVSATMPAMVWEDTNPDVAGQLKVKAAETVRNFLLNRGLTANWILGGEGA